MSDVKTWGTSLQIKQVEKNQNKTQTTFLDMNFLPVIESPGEG